MHQQKTAKPIVTWTGQDRYIGKRTPRAFTWALDPEHPQTPAADIPRPPQQDLREQFLQALIQAGVAKAERRQYLDSFERLTPSQQRQALALVKKAR